MEVKLKIKKGEDTVGEKDALVYYLIRLYAVKVNRKVGVIILSSSVSFCGFPLTKEEALHKHLS